MLIQVTQRDIDDGVRDHCTECPIALAIGRLLSGECYCEVGIDDISLGFLNRSKGIHVRLPEEAISFVRYYDDEGKRGVFPFEFELPIPDELLRPEFRSSAEPGSVATSNGHNSSDDNYGQ